jgi:hypothetical protein
VKTNIAKEFFLLKITSYLQFYELSKFSIQVRLSPQVPLFCAFAVIEAAQRKVRTMILIRLKRLTGFFCPE